MVKHLHRRLAARTRHPDGPAESERGSLVLDILIGMAIFALIAIIAVSAIGQYRMRAYVQSAVSDAVSTANAISAAASDNVTDPDATYPTGRLNEAALDSLAVDVTGRGDRASAVTVARSDVDHAEFTVCVEHQGAYALYESNAGGLTGSGSIEKDGFAGCDSLAPERSPEQIACENDGMGGFWVEASGPINSDIPAYVDDWTGDPNSRALPWEAGLSRSDFEALLQSKASGPGGAPLSVTADWWPTSAAEQAEFGFIEEDGTGVLARNGSFLFTPVVWPGFPAHCNHT